MTNIARCWTGLLLALALAGCGGDAEERKVGVWLELPAAPNSYFTQPGSSIAAEKDLIGRGVTPSNKRCAKDSSYRLGQLVLFVEGIPPLYVLFDIPQSQLPAAREALFRPLTAGDYEIFETPFFECESRGL